MSGIAVEETYAHDDVDEMEETIVEAQTGEELTFDRIVSYLEDILVDAAFSDLQSTFCLTHCELFEVSPGRRTNARGVYSAVWPPRPASATIWFFPRSILWTRDVVQTLLRKFRIDLDDNGASCGVGVRREQVGVHAALPAVHCSAGSIYRGTHKGA